MQQITHAHGGKGGDTSSGQCAGDRPAFSGGAPGADELVQGGFVGLAVGRLPEAGIIDQTGLPNGLTERLPFSVVGGGDGHPGVVTLAAVDVVRRPHRVVIAHGAVWRVAQGVVHPALKTGTEHGFPHRQVNHLATAPMALACP